MNSDQMAMPNALKPGLRRTQRPPIRSRAFGLSLFLALLAAGCGDRVTRPLGGFLPESIVVQQGQHVVIPRWPEDATLEWTNLSGVENGYVSPKGSYHAPMRMASPRIVQIQAKDGPRTAIVNVHLVADGYDGSDCLAPGETEIRDDPNATRAFDSPPEPLLRVPPAYPDLARESGVEGTVQVRAFICACGQVSNVSVVSSIPLLDEAAVTAVEQWIYKPALANGEPVTTWVTIPVKFSLH